VGPSERPAQLEGVADQLEDLCNRAESILAGATVYDTDAASLKWLEDFFEVFGWARIVSDRLVPARASEFNWQAQVPNSADVWSQFSGYKVVARAALSSVRSWAAERRFFPETKGDFVLLHADTPFSSSLHLEALLESAQQNVWIADPYLKKDALLHLLAVRKGTSLRLLGRDEPPTAALWQKFSIERGGTSEYRICPKASMFHDRFLAIDGRLFLSGASIRQLGERFSALVEVEDARLVGHIEGLFESTWQGSTPLA